MMRRGGGPQGSRALPVAAEVLGWTEQGRARARGNKQHERGGLRKVTPTPQMASSDQGDLEVGRCDSTPGLESIERAWFRRFISWKRNLRSFELEPGL